jgi:hypothetical protein
MRQTSAMERKHATLTGTPRFAMILTIRGDVPELDPLSLETILSSKR